MKTKSFNLFSTSALALCGILLLAANGKAAEKDTLDAADVKFVKHEAAAGMAVVKIGELGVKKAARAEVRTFAEMIVTDHTKANEELKGLAATKGVELSAVIDPKHADMFQSLEKSSGAEFDKEFLAAVVSGHKKCVSNFETASTDAKDADVKAWAAKMLPGLKTHLEKAKDLQAKEVSAK
jgi:putative membrane protein